MSDLFSSIGSFFMGGSDVSQADTLTDEQKSIMSALSSGGTGAISDLYGTLGSLSSSPESSYEALPDFEGQFDAQYGDPLKQQYETDLSNIQNSGELFSGGTNANNFRAMSKFNTNLASAKAGMMMTERAAQQSSAESSYNRQLQASQLLSSLATQPLGVKAQENIVQKTPGILSLISGVGSAASNVASGITELEYLGSE